MKPTLRQKITYSYEQFIGRGGSGIFWSLLILFLLGYIFVFALRILLPEESSGFMTGAWRTLKEVMDPGNVSLGDGESFLSRLVTFVGVIIGVVLFSMVIAFITTSIDTTLMEVRKGRGKIWEEGHTIILGWNERVLDIIQELIVANESQKSACIIILANGIDKEVMDDEIKSRISDFKTTKVITTPGYPASISELKRIQAGKAKSVIVMAQCSGNISQEDKELSDNLVLKIIMALRTFKTANPDFAIISEIFNSDKRALISYFEDDSIVAIDSWNMLGKLMVQTSLTGGLEVVYDELFGFDGSEIYFYKADWGDIAFRDLAYHFPNGIPLGIFRPEEGKPHSECIMIRPDKNTKMQKNDELLILSEDDSLLKFNPEIIVHPHTLELNNKVLKNSDKKILMMGWHEVSEIYINEVSDYLDDVVFDIMIASPDEELIALIESLKTENAHFNIRLIEKNPLDLEDLTAVNPLSYDIVIILSQDSHNHDPEKVDADTLMILLLLRKLYKESGKSKDENKIITQLLNSENQELIQQTDVDDFIISNRLITKILAQLSEQPRMKWVYDELFKAEGSEIYIKPADLYFTSLPATVPFADILALASQRDEICLGYRLGSGSHNPESHFGIKLNPDKNQNVTISQGDYLIVVAENEK
ncbi:MAG: hypothetical protein K1X92_14790 [Bacteroidia bacterium]|nr:hypothetical protein [Bacteroidia bacterium]